MEQHSNDWNDYVEILRRRKLHIIVPIAVVMLISLAAAFGLPPVYRSTATILIEQQEIPQELVRSTVMGYAAERIQSISKRVLTRENLKDIANKFGLYQEEFAVGDTENAISTMRADIKIRMVSADVGDKGGKPGSATIAFELSFDSDTPDSAQKVAKELLTLFLNENIRLRTEKAAVTTVFLAEEAEKLSAHIAELEAKLAAFKERNVGKLPEMMGMNLELMQRTDRELEDVRQHIKSLEERKMFFEMQLTQIEPNTGDSPEGRLRQLQSEYLSASAVYAAGHPDLVRMRREIDILKRETGIKDTSSEIEGQILKTRAELADARQRYSSEHPDVIRLEKTLQTLNNSLEQARSGSSVGDLELKPNNPAYLSALTQLEGVKINLKGEFERRKRLMEKLAEYEHRILQIPKVEQEVLALKRDYDNSVRKYQEIKQKQLEAGVSEQLEIEHKGERFTLIEAPNLPQNPESPNRPGIMLLGTVFSFMGGFGTAAVAEFFDRSVRGARAVTMILRAPPLAMIPYIENSGDVIRRQRKVKVLLASGIAIFILGILLIHFFWIPLDVLFFGVESVQTEVTVPEGNP